MKYPIHKALPIRSFFAVQDLEKQMSHESAISKGFWIKLSKAGAPKETVTKEQAIEAALCCGWIDGQLDRFDEHYFLVRMTPRRSGSRWSAKNCATADRLAKLNRLRPAGLVEITAAKSDGHWEAAYLSQSKADVPKDLVVAISKSKAAAQFFSELDRANRYAIIYRVNDAKRAETRARRIEEYVKMLARGESLHPLKIPKSR